ncbi:hypothetical protein [Ferrovibrio sp.]|uniref:hypothetical protein n=1 Tax=Ferrovibrio sp. TaxID=1917215 RepID=UPI003D12F139
MAALIFGLWLVLLTITTANAQNAAAPTLRVENFVDYFDQAYFGWRPADKQVVIRWPKEVAVAFVAHPGEKLKQAVNSAIDPLLDFIQPNTGIVFSVKEPQKANAAIIFILSEQIEIDIRKNFVNVLPGKTLGEKQAFADSTLAEMKKEKTPCFFAHGVGDEGWIVRGWSIVDLTSPHVNQCLAATFLRVSGFHYVKNTSFPSILFGSNPELTASDALLLRSIYLNENIKNRMTRSAALAGLSTFIKTDNNALPRKTE